MKMLKFIVGVIVASGLTMPIFAQEPKQQLMQKLQQLQSFSAKFEQVVVDAQDNVVHEAAGSIALAQPNNLRWHTTDPDEILLIANGESVYQIDYFVEQVSIISQSDAVNNNPMMLLTSTEQSDWEQFNVTLLDNGFEIIAKEQGPISSLTLVFENDLLTSIRSLDSQEQESQLVFSDQIQNKPLSLAIFEPSMPAGFIIDDQRP